MTSIEIVSRRQIKSSRVHNKSLKCRLNKIKLNKVEYHQRLNITRDMSKCSCIMCILIMCILIMCILVHKLKYIYTLVHLYTHIVFYYNQESDSLTVAETNHLETSASIDSIIDGQAQGRIGKETPEIGRASKGSGRTQIVHCHRIYAGSRFCCRCCCATIEGI